MSRTDDEYKSGAQRPGSTGSKLSGIGLNRNSAGSLGWSYTHVTAGMKKEAAQKISGFMASVG